MTLKELGQFMRAALDCFPGLQGEALCQASRGLEELAPGGRWEAGLSGAWGFERLALRRFGDEDAGAFRAWSVRAAQLLGRGLAEGFLQGPARGFPWLEACWNLRSGEPCFSRFLGRAERSPDCVLASHWGPGGERRTRLAAGPFSPGVFAQPALDKALADLSRLCPIKDWVRETSLGEEEPGAPTQRWALRLREPLPWPAFLRLDVAAGFSAHASQSCLLVLDREVRELLFDGDALWAFFSG